MIKLIINYDGENTTITAAAVSPDTGELWAASVLEYSKDAEGPTEDLKHLAKYGNHVSEKAPTVIHGRWGDLIHGAFSEYVESHCVEGKTPWEVLSNTPSGAISEVMPPERVHELVARTKASLAPASPTRH